MDDKGRALTGHRHWLVVAVLGVVGLAYVLLSDATSEPLWVFVLWWSLAFWFCVLVMWGIQQRRDRRAVSESDPRSLLRLESAPPVVSSILWFVYPFERAESEAIATAKRDMRVDLYVSGAALLLYALPIAALIWRWSFR